MNSLSSKYRVTINGKVLYADDFHKLAVQTNEQISDEYEDYAIKPGPVSTGVVRIVLECVERYTISEGD